MFQGFSCPPDYKSLLNLKETEKAIKLLKDFFQMNLSSELRLRRITAPLFVTQGSGINDDLNGVETPVTFNVKGIENTRAEIVHSLAKWKRMMLADLEISCGYGIYTDMNAIRPDEDLDNLHSLYVDQWDWERHISKDERSLDFLLFVVKKIYEALKRTEYLIYESFPQLTPTLPENITFVHTEDMLKMYPDLTPKEREDRIAKEHKAVFIIGIGSLLSNGKKHDGRAPDYDDWITNTENGNRGLNGDIIVWNPLLNSSFELSSMGIRVDKDSLLEQLKLENELHRTELYWHKRLLNGELPLSIGGGIGQSRLCMFLLKKAHIGEIQSSIWPPAMIEKCRQSGIFLL
jgi:aspartate--ammonia ligase